MSQGGERAIILVVEDDLSVQAALKDALEDHGYEVATARDGAEALAYLEKAPLPTVILLDLCLPGSDGLDVHAAMRGDPRLASIPVVLQTAASPNAVARAATIASTTRVLRKPFGIEELLRAVEQARETERA